MHSSHLSCVTSRKFLSISASISFFFRLLGSPLGCRLLPLSVHAVSGNSHSVGSFFQCTISKYTKPHHELRGAQFNPHLKPGVPSWVSTVHLWHIRGVGCAPCADNKPLVEGSAYKHTACQKQCAFFHGVGQMCIVF